MVSYNRPEVRKKMSVSIVREGYLVGILLEHLLEYGDGFVPLPATNKNIEKHGLYVPKDPSLIVALKYNDGTIIKPNNVNLYLAITSYSEEKNFQILEQIERNFGIRLLSEPSSHRPMETSMRGLFDIMVKCGSGVMDKLSDMEK